MREVIKFARKAAIFAAGFIVIIIGIILIPLPGPGLLVIFAGLFILSLEFAWAERHLDRAKSAHKKLLAAAKNNKNKNTRAPES